MHSAAPETPGSDAPLARGVLTIVLAGAALGIGFDAMLLSADPTHAIPWLRSERRVVTLEKVAGPGGPVLAATPAPAADSAAADTAVHASASRAAGARPTRAGAKRGAPRPATAAAAQAPPPPPRASADPAPASPAAGAAPHAALPAIPESADPMQTTLDVLEAYQAQGAALVLDARSAEEYAEGHIAGAISLPFDDVFKHPELIKTVSPGKRPVITYCGGGDCELSRSLAFAFVDAGYRRVLVFTGGLPAWKDAGLPVHSGAQP